MLIILKNIASVNDDFVKSVACHLESVFSQTGISPKATVIPDGSAKILGPTGAVVYLGRLDGFIFSAVEKATGSKPQISSVHGGLSANSAQGVASEAYVNFVNSRSLRDAEDVAWTCLHELIHNKSDVGSAQIGTPLNLNGRVISDMHTQGGGGILGKPAQNVLTEGNKRFITAVIHRRVPQFTGLL